MPRTRPASEAAFSLVEAIVAMVIGVLVMTMALFVLTNGKEAADDATAGEAAARQTTVLTSTLTSDVRSARAPGRDDVDDPIELAELIAAPGITAVSDILRAGPDELQLLTRARAATVTSCVWWRRDAAGNVTRAIHADPGCGGAPTRTDTLGVVPRTATARQPGIAALFTYGVLRDDDASTGDPTKCHVERTSTPTPLGAIVEVGAAFDLNARTRTHGRRQASMDFTGVRSRDEAEYRAALGCAW